MLSNPLLVDIIFFILGFVLLTGGAEFLIRGASRIAARFNVSNVVIGLTIVAFGTSLPELLVSVVANLSSESGSEIAIGNIVGSNIANLGLILGLAGLVAAIPVEAHLIRREFPLLLFVSVLFAALTWDGSLGRIEGIILIVGLFAFTYSSYTSQRTTGHSDPAQATATGPSVKATVTAASGSMVINLLLVLIGLGALLLGADWLVNSASSLARAIGVSELVIGLTLVAVGTSLPELATTVVAVLRKEGDIAVGNVVGSNLFNMLFIGGLSGLIKPLPVPVAMRFTDFPVMLGISLLAYLLAVRKPHRIVRWQGTLLLILYLLYSAWLFLGSPAT
jgi:cation:H+ antiporter